MASGWLKAFRCKSVAIEDVYHHQPPMPKKQAQSPSFSSSSSSLSSSNKKRRSKLYSDLGRGNTSKHLEDIVHLTKPKPKTPKSQPLPSHPSSLPQLSNQKQRKPRNQTGGRVTSAKPLHNEKLSSLPTLIPLRPNQSSRKVVEIIFTSSWSTTAICGEIEMVFKVQNPSKKVGKFEEYRHKMRSCAGADDSRCAADGNEMMRFHSAPAVNANEPLFGDGYIFPVAGNGAIRTFSGSGGAHGRGGVGGKRRAMVICRVLAGRVWTGLNSGSDRLDCESVSIRTGELVVFDSTAVLPCFLIIYKVL